MTASFVIVAALPILVTSPVRFAFVVTVAELPLTLPAIVDEKVFTPAIVWLVVKSTKFLVVDPVPPIEMGVVPIFISTPVLVTGVLS